uniref:Uncharacterized protein n=1 Tax=Eutreptiella gymnastica TaxID=73025 RepID=A0A7S4FZU3_9EUGL
MAFRHIDGLGAVCTMNATHLGGRLERPGLSPPPPPTVALSARAHAAAQLHHRDSAGVLSFLGHRVVPLDENSYIIPTAGMGSCAAGLSLSTSFIAGAYTQPKMRVCSA